MVLYFHTVANAFYCEIKFISLLLPIFVCGVAILMEEASPPSSSLILCIFPGCPSIGIIHESMIESLLFFSLQADIAITNTAVANKSLLYYIFLKVSQCIFVMADAILMPGSSSVTVYETSNVSPINSPFSKAIFRSVVLIYKVSFFEVTIVNPFMVASMTMPCA